MDYNADTRLGIGGNHPPEPTKDEQLLAIDPEQLLVCDVADLATLFALQYPALVERSAELQDGIERWRAAHKDGALPLADDTENNALSDFMRQLRDFAGDDGEVETARKKVKRAIFDAGKIIDAWFGDLRTPIMVAHGPARHAMVGTLQYAQTAYLVAKEAAARAERERIAREAADAARKQADEAARLAGEGANAAAVDASIGVALVAEERAAAMTEDAQVSAADLVRSRSALGTTTSLQGTWDFAVTDLKALCAAIGRGDVPVTFVTVVPQAIRQSIRSKHTPLRQCPGLTIAIEHSARRSA